MHVVNLEIYNAIAVCFKTELNILLLQCNTSTYYVRVAPIKTHQRNSTRSKLLQAAGGEVALMGGGSTGVNLSKLPQS